MQKNGFDKKNGYFKSGRQYEWYEDGQLHNEDGPAYRSPKGDLQWWIHGMQHREDGPAAEYKNGDKEWFICGGKHREGAPAVSMQTVAKNGGLMTCCTGKMALPLN